MKIKLERLHERDDSSQISEGKGVKEEGKEQQTTMQELSMCIEALDPIVKRMNDDVDDVEECINGENEEREEENNAKITTECDNNNESEEGDKSLELESVLM